MDAGAAADRPGPSGAADASHARASWTLVERTIVLSLRDDPDPLQIREALLEALASSPRGVIGVLVDGTAWRFPEHRSTSDVSALASVCIELANGFRRRLALVGPSDLQFGLLRIASAHAELHGLETGVFRRREDAMRWLRLA